MYELLVRTYLCAHGKATGKGLHRATVQLVCAPEQARRAQRILPLLTEEEQEVYRRGRNAHVHSIPQHASRTEYQQATALEALLGWLWLKGRKDRVNELFCAMMEVVNGGAAWRRATLLSTLVTENWAAADFRMKSSTWSM